MEAKDFEHDRLDLSDGNRATGNVSGAVDSVMDDPGYQEYEMVWKGIDLLLRYNPCWLGRCAELRTHHIELLSADRAVLPVTSTGYRSHFLHGEDPFSEFDGDVLTYVQAWLDAQAERPEWKRHVEASRQLSLF